MVLFYCCGMTDRVVIKTSVCHLSSGTHIASGTWWLVLWGRILEARWCLPMHEQPHLESNRWDLGTFKTSGSKDIYFCAWVGKRARSGEKEQIMIHTQPPNSRQNNIVAEKRHNGRVIDSWPILFTIGMICHHHLDVSLGSCSCIIITQYYYVSQSQFKSEKCAIFNVNRM